MGAIRIRKSKHPRYAWEVSWERAGKRVRRFVKTRGEAERIQREELALREVLTDGEPGLSPDEVRALRMARAAGVSLAGLVESALALQAQVRGRTMAEAAAGALDEVSLRMAHTKRSRYFYEWRNRIRDIDGEFGALEVEKFTAEQAQAWIYGRSRSLSRIRKRRLILRSVLDFAHRRKWVAQNVAKDVPLPLKVATGSVEILTPEETAVYLTEAAGVSPELLVFESVRAFAGIRSEELFRITWEDFRLNRAVPFIEVGRMKSKTKTRRLVTIQPALLHVLQQFPGRTGRLKPRDYLKKRDLAMKRAGYFGTALYNKPHRPKNGRQWPQNALRHSFVSYHLAMWEDAGKTALEAGHTVQILFAHYRELVTREEAERYWNIRINYAEPFSSEDG